MKNFFRVVMVLYIGAGLSACSPKIKGVNNSLDNETFVPKGPMFWVAPSGIYKGAIPCSDCPGIEVTLNFKKDYSIEKTMRYINKGGQTKKMKGTWVVQAGNIVQINYSGSVEFYKAQAGAHLIALNAKKEVDENQTGQFNIFNKYD